MLVAQTNWVLFIGRFHPVLVHLPIGIMVLLAILEIVGIKPSQRDTIAKVRRLIVPVLAICALIGATCGWLLASGGGYNPSLLFWHRWLGVTVAGLCVLMMVETRFNFIKTYFATLAVSVIAVAITGHLGGSMTYGSNYLTEYAPQPIKSLLGIPSRQQLIALPKLSHIKNAVVYPQIIQAIFNQNCIDCHGVDRQKGGLRLDSYHELMQGAHNRPVVLPGDAARSKLIRWINLPIADSHHMPPRSHRQLTGDELAILKWWVQSGAVDLQPLNKHPPPLQIMADIRKLFAATASHMPLSRLKIEPMLPALARQTGMRITFLSKKSAMLGCSARHSSQFTDRQLAMLRPIRLNIADLNLDSAKVTNAAIKSIDKMVNLEALHLRQTLISPQGLLQMDHLAHLRYLSVPSHKVTAADIRVFKQHNFTPHLVVTGNGGVSDLPNF